MTESVELVAVINTPNLVVKVKREKAEKYSYAVCSQCNGGGRINHRVYWNPSGGAAIMAIWEQHVCYVCDGNGYSAS